jgi:ECL1/2/3 zinc binding proteins
LTHPLHSLIVDYSLSFTTSLELILHRQNNTCLSIQPFCLHLSDIRRVFLIISSFHQSFDSYLTMPSFMDWSPDYCLSCDKQTSGDAYCSQACRLADLEASGSAPPSPMNTESSPFGAPTGFYLPPPIDWSAYRHNSSNRVQASRPAAQHTPSNFYSRYSITSPVKIQASPKRTLTPSTSRTSLSSLGSSASAESVNMSEDIRSELRSYASSFDHVRDWKRRMTS